MPVRLRHIELRSSSFASPQVLELTPLVALWGTNDAGKSTTLRALHSALEPAAAADDGGEPNVVVMDVDLTTAEELAIRALEIADYDDCIARDGEWINVFEQQHSADEDKAREAASDDGRLLEHWVQAYLDAEGSDVAESDNRASLVADARLLTLIPDGDSWGSAGWSAWWTLPCDPRPDLPLSQRIVAPAVPGIIGDLLFPEPIAVPLDWAALDQEFNDAVGRVVQRAQTIADGGTVGARADRGLVADALAAASTRQLPSFVSSRYTLLALKAESRQHCDLLARRAADGLVCSVAAMAQGFHLWTQLAILSAIRRVDELIHIHPVSPAVSVTDEDSLSEVLTSPFDDRWDPELLVTAIDEVYEHSGLAPETATDEELISPRQRVVIIDEPEAHLHPAAQRQAARWLSERSGELGFEVILMASHSPSFLGARGLTGACHIRRTPTFHIDVRSLDPRYLNADDEEIHGMGFDRGELLAFYQALLFVEGQTDLVVLEELCGDRLRDLGVLVQPFHGTKHHERITEAEVLMRVLGPPIHVVVDGVSGEYCASLDGMNLDELEHAARSKRIEERFLARVTITARRERRTIMIHTIEAVDMLELLDDGVVASLAPDRARRPYPGFGAAFAEAEQAGQSYTKRFEEMYGIRKSPEFFRECARVMHAQAVRVPKLDECLDAIEASIGAGRRC